MWQKFKEKLFSGLVVLSTIGGLLAYSIFWPHVSIEQHVTLDPKNPFETVFVLTNESVLPVSISSIDATMIDVRDANDNHFTDSTLYSVSKINLYPHKKTAVKMEINTQYKNLTLPLKNAQIRAVVTYKYLFIIPRKSIADFLMVYNSAGDANWVPVDHVTPGFQ